MTNCLPPRLATETAVTIYFVQTYNIRVLNDEIRMTKPATAQLRVFRHSGFGFLSSFVIRHSSINDLCKSGSWSQYMQRTKGALHEPSEAPPGFGVRQSSGALAMEASQPKAPEHWRSPRRYRAIRRFMVPMHAKKRKGALHEPQGAAGLLDRAENKDFPGNRRGQIDKIIRATKKCFVTCRFP